MASQADSQFSLRSILIPAFGPAVMFGVAEGAVLPVVALSARDRGASVAMASVVVALIGVGSLLSNIPSAVITTRFGERKAIIAAAAVSAIAMIIAATAPTAAVLGLAMLLIGFANAVFNLARQSYLTEAVPIELRARALSTLGGSARIGIFIGPFIGAAVIPYSGIRAAYLVGFVAALLAGATAMFSRDLVAKGQRDKKRASTSIRSVLVSHRQIFLTVGVGVVLISAVRASRQVVIPLWAEHLNLSPSATSIIYGLSGAIDMLVFYPAGKLMDRRGRQWVSLPSMILMGVSLLLVPLSTGFVSLLLPALMLGFGNGIGAGMVATLGADFAPPDARPSFLAIWRLLSDTGSCAGPVVLSAVTSLATLAVGVESNGGIGFAAAAILAYWIPRTRNRRASAVTAEPAGPDAGVSSSGLPDPGGNVSNVHSI
ncbi:MAG TPA: MFS transporter [Jatrophihabitans sp.]